MPAFSSRRSEAPQLVGRWLLCDGKGDAVRAAIEVQGARAGFSTLLALLSPVDGEGGWTAPQSREALSFLVSALAILTEADLIKLVPLSVACGRELTQLGFGTEQQVWTPLSSLARLASAEAGRSLPVVHIDAHAWWELETAGRDRQALAYLEKRIQLADELAKPPLPPPRGVLARLARLLSGRH